MRPFGAEDDAVLPLPHRRARQGRCVRHGRAGRGLCRPLPPGARLSSEQLSGSGAAESPPGGRGEDCAAASSLCRRLEHPGRRGQGKTFFPGGPAGGGDGAPPPCCLRGRKRADGRRRRSSAAEKASRLPGAKKGRSGLSLAFPSLKMFFHRRGRDVARARRLSSGRSAACPWSSRYSP